MKKITLLLMLLSVSLGYSQALHTIDFEPAGVGSGWSWTADDIAPSFSEIANPVSGGINTSATVVEFIAYTTDFNWTLCHTSDDGTFTFDGTNSTLKMMVYKPTLSRVTIKVEGAGPPTELNSANTVINQWEELTFDASALIGQSYNKIVIIPDFVEPYVDGTDRTTDNTLYFDNIIVPDGVVTVDPEPSDAPTAPSISSSDVISVFSEAAGYGNLPATWNPNWGQSTVYSEETIAANLVKKYSSFSFSGIEPTGGTIDAATPGMTHINFDYWTSDATDLAYKLVDYEGDGAWSPTNIEVEISKPVTVTDAWGTMSIALSEYTAVNGAIEFDDIGQMVISAVGAVNSVYIDNIYFSIGSALSVEKVEIAGLEAYPNPTSSSWTISTQNEEIRFVEVFNILGKRVLLVEPNDRMVNINVESLASGIYISKISTDSGVSTRKLIKE
ncbi:MAG: T9SS type A sorting domain-containing protein [Urechidicola sp.]|nr:T9SS type A sorting domain-containing protein [Urechidicola sp.]